MRLVLLTFFEGLLEEHDIYIPRESETYNVIVFNYAGIHRLHFLLPAHITTLVTGFMIISTFTKYLFHKYVSYGDHDHKPYNPIFLLNIDILKRFPIITEYV